MRKMQDSGEEVREHSYPSLQHSWGAGGGASASRKPRPLLSIYLMLPLRSISQCQARTQLLSSWGSHWRERDRQTGKKADKDNTVRWGSDGEP